MKPTCEQLSSWLAQAEQAHKVYEGAESGTVKTPWPTFYAEWMLDNTPLGQKRKPIVNEWDVRNWNMQDWYSVYTLGALGLLVGIAFVASRLGG